MLQGKVHALYCPSSYEGGKKVRIVVRIRDNFRNTHRMFLEDSEGRYRLGDLDIDRMIILKCILNVRDAKV
jgi:hypothetical protein